MNGLEVAEEDDKERINQIEACVTKPTKTSKFEKGKSSNPGQLGLERQKIFDMKRNNVSAK